jgi:phosphorylase/glycogen(starch) synthase
MAENLINPDYLFEVSWEICNKVGGIHTVVATKAITLVEDYGDNYIVIGPDIIRDEAGNSEFNEDRSLFRAWRRHALSEGLRVKTGRWNINGSPLAMIIDFSNWINQKDKIFSEFWEKYKLNSLSGQWDYIEPAIFGYASAKVIESFIRYNLATRDRIVAQFHEWLTGTGILYLKSALPQVATVFTTHATVIGRSLAGNKRPLYKNLKDYNSDDIAKEYNIISKQSLEELSAQHADAFTTVSEITAKECSHFLKRNVDFITPNGFEDIFVPKESEFYHKRETARNKLIGISELLLNTKFSKNIFLIATSGRYEFRNKGIDLFIDSLGKLNKNDNTGRSILAFILIPANHYGPRKDLLRKINGEKLELTDSKYLTHNLHDADWDPILKRIKNAGLKNEDKDRVKVIFVPSYLNGDDGIFDMPYYDILIGFDLTVFPSYYEPWGYTPLESLAFSVPTLTTSLSGFGLWSQKEYEQKCDCIAIIERTDDNDEEVIVNIVNDINTVYNLKDDDIKSIKEKAYAISRTALWENLIVHYKQAYDFALNKVSKRVDLFVEIEQKQAELVREYIKPKVNEPVWKRIIVKSKLPEKLNYLNELTKNLWWTWDDDAQSLFEQINPEIWQICENSPAILFEQVNYDRLLELSNNEEYIKKLEDVFKRYQKYMSETTNRKQPKIAYFSMEYGIHNSLKLYSGGLGILAGDYLKEASDSKIDIIGLGLLYRYGYFTQLITTKGDQQTSNEFQHFSKLPVIPQRDKNEDFLTIKIVLPGRVMHARIWELNVGRIKLYLLDTDFEANIPEDRDVTYHLYGGNTENRLKQEMLLGIGGTRALDALGIEPDLYHNNEGHSAFVGLERMRKLIQIEKLDFNEAQEIVRASTLFTTHTPVPAGHDEFDEDLLRQYIGHYPERLKTGWDELMALGRANPNDWNEKFNMSYLAARFAADINGVSMIHCSVTQDIFARLWPGYLPEELHIGYVTNGVHYPTWTAREWKVIYNENFEDDFLDTHSGNDSWRKIYDVPDKVIWETKQQLRSNLIIAIRERFKENWIKRHEDPKQIIAINDTLSENALTVCFARRFATYKRAHLLFENLDRLSKLLNIPDKPVQFIFAGKAHPNDKAGQDMIKMIVETSKKPQYLGKILFLQNYDMALAKLLVQGADVWLNTPTRPLEASGTSGEKAVLNGTLHFSVLDGWWVEGYQPEAGWALTNARTYEDQQFQDDLDAEIIYSIFEHEVIPDFYNRNKAGIPVEWINMIKNSIAKIAPGFTTRRMINDYVERYYSEMYERKQDMSENDYEKTINISSWKKHIAKTWNDVEVIEVNLFDKTTEVFQMGQKYKANVILDLKDIPPENIGVELIVSENYERLITRQEFNLGKYEGTKAYYDLDVMINQPGTFTYGIRMFPKHDLLAHRQDIDFLRWI